MSQISNLSSTGTILPDVETLTGDTGGAVGPDGALNIDILGGIGASVAGNPGTNTLTINAGGVDQDNIIYVGKHGNDANDGLTINEAKLTFASAITAATAGSPTALNRYTIQCLDAGIYTETITVPEYVSISAVNATLTGTILLGDNSIITFGSVIVLSATTGINKSVGTGDSICNVGTMTVAGIGIGVLCTAGSLVYRGTTMTIENGYGFGDGTTAEEHVHIALQHIYITGTGTALARANAGSTFFVVTGIEATGAGTGTAINCIAGNVYTLCGRITTTTGIISTNGDINAVIGELVCTTAYNMGAGSTAYFFITELAGTQTNAGSLNMFLGNGTSYTQDIISTGLTDSSRTADAIAVYTTGGELSEVGPLTNGQLAVGSTGNAPVATTLTAGTGVAITNGAGSITVSTTGGGLAWQTIGASSTLAVNNGYICSSGAALALALPATSSVGDTITVTLDGSTSWTITQAAGQSIQFGSSTTTVGAGGSLASTADGDTITMVCSVANLKFNVISSIGNITLV